MIAACVASLPAVASAQSLDDLELRKRKKAAKIGFSMLGIFETAASLNRDRPTLTNLLFLAPQLKIGSRMRLRLNAGFFRNWLERQTNPWDVTDLSLQFSHLGFYREPHSKILLSGFLRYAFPTSKASRNAGSRGQLRGMLRASRGGLFKRLFFAFQFTAFKNFHKHTSWDTSKDPLDSGTGGAAYDFMVQNNINYGFSQTFTASVRLPIRCDLNIIYGLRQGRQYRGADSGSSATGAERATRWVHANRLVLDLTTNIAGLFKVDVKRGGFGRALAARSFLSFGYASFKPQIVDGKRDLNPFDPRFSSLYLDLVVVY